MTYVQAYVEAFQRCYPQTSMHVRNRWDRTNGTMTHYVVINGDRGEFALNEEQMRSATRDFNRGKEYLQ